MALAAVAFAKAKNRRQMMACTTSIGPGAANMVTAAGVAHVNRLPVLFLPGDVFASRRPDPVLQQIEDFNDATISVNDCFRPVSRWWDRITRPEQLLTSLPRAIQVLTDPVDCGPVTLCMAQDVQAEAYDYPESFFRPQTHRIRRPAPDADEFARALDLLAKAERPLIIAGGGVLYSRSHANASGFRREARHPGRRNPGRQKLHAVGPPAGRRLRRRHRQQRFQHAGARGRRDPGGRHPATGFHDRLPRPGAGRSGADPAQHSGFRRGQAPRRAAYRRRQADAGRPHRRPRRVQVIARSGSSAPRR